jgi:toxin ParE1/3/4
MDRRLEISKEAIRDLDEIWDYIAGDSIVNADRFIDELFFKCEEIAQLKGVGRKRDELILGLKSLAHKNYVIFFAQKEDIVSIVRILSGVRDIESVFHG